MKIIKILTAPRNLYNLIKICRNHARFKKYATCGYSLRLYKDSFIKSDKVNKITIGNNCDLSCRITSSGDGEISIGNNTFITNGSTIESILSVKIGNAVIIAGNVHIQDNDNHPTDPQKRLEMSMCGDFYGDKWQWDQSATKPIVIEDNVWIGERSAVLKGVTIGKGSVIGCNTVVTKDIPPYSVAVGNPARVVKRFEKYLKNIED